MSSTIVNGKINDRINIHDRGFQYGDGLFETIVMKNNELQMWDDHLARMSLGCEKLGLPVITADIWLNDIQALNIKQPDAIIKLILTRGTGERGYRASSQPDVTRVVSTYELVEYPESYYTQGINLIFCKTSASINSTLAGIKHLNRLENVLARNEWNDDNIHEGLLSNEDGYVIEGTMSNIFAVNNNILYTPILNKSGVAGVMRNRVIELAKESGIEFQQINLSKELLSNMDEIFITNSLIGICPVAKLEDEVFNPGNLTLTLMNKLDLSIGCTPLKHD